jgi:hypothetical protein
MKRLSLSIKRAITIILVATAASLAVSVWAAHANAQIRLGGATGAMFPAYQATSLSSSQLINPEELVSPLVRGGICGRERDNIRRERKERRWVVRKASRPAGRGLRDSNPASGSNQFQPED